MAAPSNGGVSYGGHESALSSITKICPATIQYYRYSTDFELVILFSLLHTYYMGMIPQPVSLVEFHLQ